MSESHKGKPIWNKGLTKETDERVKNMGKGMSGKNHYFYGKLLSKEHRRKISEGNKGKHTGKYFSLETRKKMSEASKGRHHTEETKRKISEGHKGEKAYWYGKHLLKETRKKLSEAHKGGHHTEEVRRRMSEARKGEKNVNWNNGSSFEPYTPDFNKAFKKKIRERDNNCCVVCNKSQKELKRILNVHHIDYNKLNSFPQNCVSLCVSCHMITNANRITWKIFFQKLLKEKYNYQYTQDQKIILDYIAEKCNVPDNPSNT